MDQKKAQLSGAWIICHGQKMWKELNFQVQLKWVFKLSRIEELQWKVANKRPNLERQKTYLIGLKYFMPLEHSCGNLWICWLLPPSSRQADDFIPVSKLKHRQLSKHKTHLVLWHKETWKSCISQMEIVPNHHNQWNPAEVKMLLHAVLPQSDQRARFLMGFCKRK